MKKFCLMALTLIGLLPAPGFAEVPDQFPEPLFRPAPYYPRALYKKRVSGSVMIEFIVDKDGLVRQAQVKRSTNSGFDDNAVEAIRRWRFKPGQKNGQPVAVRAQQSLSFSVPVHRQLYPFELLQAGTDGSAQLGYWLDANQHLAKSVVLKASDPVFGQAALAALADDLQSSPGQIPVVEGRYEVTYTYKHKEKGELASVTDSAREILKLLKKNSSEICSAEELDRAPVLLAKLDPEFPVNLQATTNSGEAVVEFFIDRQGNVQLPRIVSASQEDFGYAAAQAMGQWQFEAPLRQGKPVVARVRMPVEFKLGGDR